MIYSVWRKTSPLCPKQHNETKPISSFPNIRFFQQQQNILWWARVRVTCKLKTNNVSTRTVRYFELVGLTNIRHTNEQVVIVTRLNRCRSHFRHYTKFVPSNEKLIVRISSSCGRGMGSMRSQHHGAQVINT